MARRLIEFRGFVGWAFPTISIIGGSASGLREEVLARFSNSFLGIGVHCTPYVTEARPHKNRAIRLRRSTL
jgi:hypothetical protein